MIKSPGIAPGDRHGKHREPGVASVKREVFALAARSAQQQQRQDRPLGTSILLCVQVICSCIIFPLLFYALLIRTRLSGQRLRRG